VPVPLATEAFDVLTTVIDVVLVLAVVGGGVLLWRQFGKGDDDGE
jgi:hypothetical protein